MSLPRGRSVLAAAAVVLRLAGAASAPIATAALRPGEIPGVTVTSDRGQTLARMVSMCTTQPNGGLCVDGTVLGSPALHASRGAPLTVHVDGGATPAGMTFHDTRGQFAGSAGPDPTFAPLPPGTVQFTVPAILPTGGYASVSTSWSDPGYGGDATYAVRLLFAGELAATQVRRVELLRRHRRTRPPGLLVRVSDPGTITVRWRSGARSGRRTARVARETATVALLGLPGRPRHRVRVTVTLDPAAPGLAPARLTRVFGAAAR